MVSRNSEAHALAVPRTIQPGSVAAENVPSFQAVYEKYFDFVWASARRLGVDSSAIDDVVQEIFIAVHANYFIALSVSQVPAVKKVRFVFCAQSLDKVR